MLIGYLIAVRGRVAVRVRLVIGDVVGLTVLLPT